MSIPKSEHAFFSVSSSVSSSGHSIYLYLSFLSALHRAVGYIGFDFVRVEESSSINE